ncbi:hypothetical protein SGRIM128S_03370 [Streptomyces griseomycini]
MSGNHEAPVGWTGASALRQSHVTEVEELREQHAEELAAHEERYAALGEREKDRYEALAARHDQLLTLLGQSLRGPLEELRRELAALAADDAGQLWPEANQVLHHLSAGYSRITTLIDNVLGYQRLDTGTEGIARTKVMLDAVVAAGVDGAVELIGPGRVQFAVHAPPIEAEVDSRLLATALAHLVADVAGVDATGNTPVSAGGYLDNTVVVAAAQRGEVVRIEVRGPYGGGDPVHEPIVRGIVRAHGGVLQTHEVPGMSGSAFVLEVPIGGGAGAVPAAAVPVAPVDGETAPAGDAALPSGGGRRRARRSSVDAFLESEVPGAHDASGRRARRPPDGAGAGGGRRRRVRAGTASGPGVRRGRGGVRRHRAAAWAAGRGRDDRRRWCGRGRRCGCRWCRGLRGGRRHRRRACGGDRSVEHGAGRDRTAAGGARALRPTCPARVRRAARPAAGAARVVRRVPGRPGPGTVAADGAASARAGRRHRARGGAGGRAPHGVRAAARRGGPGGADRAGRGARPGRGPAGGPGAPRERDRARRSR